MVRGLYTSALGMANNQRRMDTISNNLANVDTTGYKKDVAVSSSFAEVMTDVIKSSNDGKIGRMALGVGVDDTATNFSQGSIKKTENPLDLAIKNSDLAFFCVKSSDSDNAQEMYTKDGGFTVNKSGQLTTKDGYIVKGQQGPIELNSGSVTINSDGTIIEDGEVVDKLLIKEFKSSENLQKRGENLIIDSKDSETKEFSGQVIQGALEASNVNSVSEMVDMMNVVRSYEANQKVLQSVNSTLQKAVTQVGRL